jgi:hypothetical protein
MSGATARLISWRPLQKGSLRGFCNIELPSGLVLRDISVHISHGKAWAGLPAKPVIDSGGRHHIVDGKKQYAPIAEWKSKALRDGFSDRVVSLVRDAHPADLGNEVAP